MKTAWVLTGDGINCEVETAEACRRAGFVTEIVHLKEAIGRSLSDCSLLVVPGGFSFGDELGSGRMLSLQIQHLLKWDLRKFALEGGVVIGIWVGRVKNGLRNSCAFAWTSLPPPLPAAAGVDAPPPPALLFEELLFEELHPASTSAPSASPHVTVREILLEVDLVIWALHSPRKCA